MADITVVDTGGDVTSGGTNPSDSLTGLVENDVVYAVLSSSASGDQTMAMISSGYTNIIEDYASHATYMTNAAVFRKVMGATPDTTITSDGVATGSRSDAMSFIALRNVDTTTPEDGVTPLGAKASSDNVANPPSITPATDGAMVLATGCASLQESDTSGGPSGYSNFTENGGGGFTAYTLAALATKIIDPAVAENPGTFGFTQYNESYVAFSIAIRPLIIPAAFTQKDYRWRNDDGALTEPA